MEEFAERPSSGPVTEKRKQYLDHRIDALTRWGMYTVGIVGVTALFAILTQGVTGRDPRTSDFLSLVFVLAFLCAAICMFICLGNGVLAIWAWSTLAVKSSVKLGSSPLRTYWRRPYAPRVAIIVLVILASVPAIYYRFQNPPLFLGILALVAVISKRIASRF